MINKLTKMFAASQEAPVKTPEPPPAPPAAEAQTETPLEQNPAVQDNVQQPLAAENISFLKLCDAKLAKLSQFFTGSEEAVATPMPVTEERNNEAATSPLITPEPTQEAAAAENISLLQLCDAKLSKWTKFFTGSEETPVIKQETQEELAAPHNDARSAISPTMQEQSVVSADTPAPGTQDTLGDTVTATIAEPPSPQENALAADNSIEAVKADAEAIVPPVAAAPNATQETPVAYQPAETLKIPPCPFPENKPQGMICIDNTEAIAELNRKIESTISEQLLNLERRLDQHIEDAIHAESEHVAFRAELRQQLHAAQQSHEQPLIEHKNTIETILKSAFKKIVDRQAILENKYNQQIDMIQQVIGTNQENIGETAGELNKLSEQTRLLNENIQQLMQNIEAFQAKVDIDTVNTRLETLENPPKKKRKSWFKK